jgi:hypothetical protein
MPLTLYRRGKVWHYAGTVAGQRLRGSCKTTDQAIAARTAAKIETNQWKCHFDGPESVLTFAQAAGLYKATGKPVRFLTPIENYWKDVSQGHQGRRHQADGDDALPEGRQRHPQ